MTVERIYMGSERVTAGPIGYMMRPGGALHVVFLHGLGCARESFIEAFKSDWFDPTLSLLAPDLPGHGDSPRDPDYSYDLDVQAYEILELLDKLRIQRAVLVAHSIGNICGLKLARKIQEPIGYYCLEGNLIASDCQLSTRIAKYDETTFVTKFHPIAHQQFQCPNCAERGADPIALYRSAASLVRHCADDLPLQQFLDLELTKAYFYGSRNATMPVLSRFFDKVDLVEVPNAGHFVMNDAPEFVWREIARRVASQA